jgi:protein involved in polysaccharide export with SLBB domain
MKPTLLIALATLALSLTGTAGMAQTPATGAAALPAGGPSVLTVPPLAAPTATTAAPPPMATPLDLARSSATSADGAVAQVYGTQLFSGAFSAARPTKDSSYLIQPGDQIAVRIYGAINVDAVQTVDTSGALFIQGIGPVNVANAPASQLQARLTAALRGVYNDSVGVYVDVLQGGSIGVFLAGDVNRPGRYLGSPGDSVLYFLDQAGGIDATRGSFRQVTVRRDGQTLASYDLYDFMTEGRLASFNFRNGDVIYVARRGPMVVVTGEAGNAYAFEAPAGQTALSGADLIQLARPSATVCSVGVTRVRDGFARGEYFTRAAFAESRLGAGDRVEFRSEIFSQTVSVSLVGDLMGPSIMVLPRGARLSDLLAQVPLDQTDIEPTYVHIERRSVAVRQKEALNRSLDTLLRAALTTPTSSAEGAMAAAQQSDQIAAFVGVARQAQPAGKVAVYIDDRFNDLQLEDGDRVIFPRRTDVVVVAGEVLNPGAFVHAGDLRIRDYVDRAGGFAENANRGRFALRRPDGSARIVRANDRPRPGDEIVIVPAFADRRMILFRDLTQIAFQIATTAAAVINITE